MTYEPIPYATPVGPGLIENSRRGGLMAFGIVSILIGSLAGCMTLAMVVGMIFMARTVGAWGGSAPDLPVAQMIAGGVMYLAAAVLFIWAGVDSIRCRRWVRPVTISVGWITLVGSIFSIAAMIVTFPGASAFNSPVSTVTTTTPGGAVVTSTTSTASMGPTSTGMLIGMVIGAVVLGIIVPAAYIWFYSTAAVKATLAAYQPAPSWTERCPLPLFVACTALLVGGISTAIMALNASTPFFGIYLEGPAAVALTLAAAAVMFIAMVLIYRVQRIGWWAAFIVIALGFTSAIMTMCKLGMLEFYKRGHASSADLYQLTQMSAAMGIMPIVMSAALGVLCLGYLIWVYRYFGRAERMEPQ